MNFYPRTVALFMANPENWKKLRDGNTAYVAVHIGYLNALYGADEDYLIPDNRVVVVGIYGMPGIFCRATKFQQAGDQVTVTVEPIKEDVRIKVGDTERT